MRYEYAKPTSYIGSAKFVVDSGTIFCSEVITLTLVMTPLPRYYRGNGAKLAKLKNYRDSVEDMITTVWTWKQVDHTTRSSRDSVPLRKWWTTALVFNNL